MVDGWLGGLAARRLNWGAARQHAGVWWLDFAFF
jgi:hypothetical protein